MQLLKKTWQEFFEDDCFGMAAALSYYTIFSLPPLLVVIVSVSGLAVNDPAQRRGQGWQDSRIESRLIALERQIQQLLSDVREIRNQVGYDSPQAPRQTFRPESETQQSYRPETRRQFDGQGSQSSREGSYPSDEGRDNQGRSDF